MYLAPMKPIPRGLRGQNTSSVELGYSWLSRKQQICLLFMGPEHGRNEVTTPEGATNLWVRVVTYLEAVSVLFVTT